MKEAIKSMVDASYPELAGGHHLPMFGQVVAVRETPSGGAVADPFRPFLAADVQVLDQHGKPDARYEVLKDVPLPVGGAGQESGFFAMPGDGSRVELGFAYGSPNQPFVRSVQAHELSLPPLGRNEQRWQHSAGSYQVASADGSWHLATDQSIVQDSLRRVISSMEDLQSYVQSLINVEADATERVGGTKLVEAMGAVRLHSGGRTELIALQDTVMRSSGKQDLKAPKTWVGSEGENVLRIVSEFMGKVIELTNILQSHTHSNGNGGGDTGAPIQAGSISSNKSGQTAIKDRLDPITE